MKIVNKLTLRHLKGNRGRTIVTTLGICVCVAMITAVFVAAASFLNLFGEIELLANGDYHARLTVNSVQLKSLESDVRIEKVGVIPAFGDDIKYTSYQLEKRSSNRSGTGDFYTGDKAQLEQMFTGSYDGEIPKNGNEIAVEQSLIDKNELDWKLGDTVLIPVGYRFYTENGEIVYTGGSYIGSEKFSVEEVREYKITAILHDNPSTAPSYQIIRGCDFGVNAMSASDTATAFITLKKVNHNSLNVIKDIIKKNNITDYEINKNYLETKFAYDESNGTISSVIGIGIIMLAIIIIASVVLIYNAFAMSISERVRYLGMLASVGATKRQKRRSVYFECFILGAIGIPVGILCGIAGIGVTLKIIGGKIISSGMILGVTDDNLQMKIVVPLYAIIGIIAVSAFTIFISALVPSLKASKITPIDAIRQRREITVSAKKLKSSPVVRAVFGYEGELANKNLKRNGRKARVITASIALSVVLFLCCNYFCQMFSQAINLEASVPYQVTALVEYGKKDEFLKELDNIGGIDNYYSVANSTVYISAGNADFSQLTDESNLKRNYKNLYKNDVCIYVNYIDDEAFNAMCAENGIDSSEYYGSSDKVLLLNNLSRKDDNTVIFENSVKGKEFTLHQIADDGSSADIKLTIGATVPFGDGYAYKLAPQNTIAMYMPLSEHIKITNGVKSCLIGIETNQHADVTEKLQELQDKSELGISYISDYEDSIQVMNTVVFIMEILIYGFIALISLITVFNIINTVSTGIAMRKKEFAMLKSVGTSPKGFNKMIMLESAFYGIKAMIFALPISVLLSYALNRVITEYDSAIAFSINIPLYLAVTAVVFVIIGLTMLYSVNKLKGDNIIETLKNDIT